MLQAQCVKSCSKSRPNQGQASHTGKDATLQHNSMQLLQSDAAHAASVVMVACAESERLPCNLRTQSLRPTPAHTALACVQIPATVTTDISRGGYAALSECNLQRAGCWQGIIMIMLR